MHFDSKKVIVAGGSAGMGRQVAVDIVRHGGSGGRVVAGSMLAAQNSVVCGNAGRDANGDHRGRSVST